MSCRCLTPPFSSLQTSTSATRWAAPRPCARAAPARTRRAPTAAAARPATWPWPSPTTACPTQPRARRQRSSRGAAVGMLPAGNAALGPGGAEKAASEPFAPSPPKRTTPSPPSSWLRPPRAELPASVPPSSPPAPASATAEPSLAWPLLHPPPCHAPRGLAGRLPLPRSPSSSPHPAETGLASPGRASLLH